MNSWLSHLRLAFEQDLPCVLVSVAAVRGSAPREPGACMVVTPSRLIDTIGGGNLEFMATRQARAILTGARELADGGEIQRYALGPETGQCCGGVVYLHYELLPAIAPDWAKQLLHLHDANTPAIYFGRRAGQAVTRALIRADEVHMIGDACAETREAIEKGAIESARERLNEWPADRDLLWRQDDAKPAPAMLDDFVLMRPLLPDDFRVVVFGAGHVGRAVVEVLQPLADQIVWCDERQEEFPTSRAKNIQREHGDPFALIDAQPAAAYYLIMTHNHSLDMLLCEAITRRRDHAYCGLIGSASKRRRFEKLLLRQGLAQEDLKRLICPMGINGIKSKQPAAIAVSVVAELLRTREKRCLADRGRTADIQ